MILRLDQQTWSLFTCSTLRRSSHQHDAHRHGSLEVGMRSQIKKFAALVVGDYKHDYFFDKSALSGNDQDYYPFN